MIFSGVVLFINGLITLAFSLTNRLMVNIPGFQPHPEFFHFFRPRLFHRTNGIKSAPMALAIPKTP